LGYHPYEIEPHRWGWNTSTKRRKKTTEREFTTHAHVHMILSQSTHWPSEAIETPSLKLPTLHILRLASEVPGLEIDNLLALQGDNEIATSIRLASNSLDYIRQEKRSTIPGYLGTIAYDKLV